MRDDCCLPMNSSTSDSCFHPDNRIASGVLEKRTNVEGNTTSKVVIETKLMDAAIDKCVTAAK